jgi:hypothetical protein
LIGLSWTSQCPGARILCDSLGVMEQMIAQQVGLIVVQMAIFFFFSFSFEMAEKPQKSSNR